MYKYFDKNNKEFESEMHFLTAKELCTVFDIRKGDKLPYVRLGKALEFAGFPWYYYRPNPKSTFNQIKVYDYKSLTFREINLLKSVLGD